MRIVIDLQAVQAQPDTHPDNEALAMALDLARCAHADQHELWAVLNGALPSAIPAIRAAFAPWIYPERLLVFEVPRSLAKDVDRHRAALLLREHFIALLAPDCILLAGLPPTGGDAVVSIAPADTVHTALLLPDAACLADPTTLPLLLRCALVLTGSASVRQAVSTLLASEPAWLQVADSGAAALAALLASTAQPTAIPAALRSGDERHALLRQLVALRGVPLPELAYCLAQMPEPLAPRQLLVDVTAIVQHDLKTGIERVVRTQLLDLLRREHTGLQVEPVYLSDRGGRWHYRYAHAYAQRLLDRPVPEREDPVADIRAGDIFYGADYSPHALAAAANDGLFAYWRARGVSLNFVVYDLLPVLRPEFFPESSAQTQTAWLRSVASHADRLICISAAVAADLAAWLAAEQIPAPQLHALHLGADLDEEAGIPVPSESDELPAGATSAPAFLMVGTLEPRKGHLQAIDAFDQLWNDGVNANLVIIGHEGWRGLPDAERRTIPAIVARLQQHPQLGKRLFWLRGPSDAVLRQAYKRCVCLLAASDGEGFGLPLIEAARYGMPVLARALPVFREVAGEHASYFGGDAPADLAAALAAWLAAHARGVAIGSDGMPWQTWHENVDALLAILQHRGLPLQAGQQTGL